MRLIVVQFVADTLMCLYKVNWSPLSPINVSSGGREGITNKSKKSTHVAICFIKDDEEITQNSDLRSDCLCIESYRSTYLGFMNVTNSVLLELVNTIREVWRPGVVGVSDGVMSVIADYCHPNPDLLTGYDPQMKGEDQEMFTEYFKTRTFINLH